MGDLALVEFGHAAMVTFTCDSPGHLRGPASLMTGFGPGNLPVGYQQSWGQDG
jgi:hypothetical protein